MSKSKTTMTTTPSAAMTVISI